jgi:phosphoribosylanthranilate isomerase
MNSTAVKICGIKDMDTIRSIRQLPVDYVGFVFAASKRQVSPHRAKELIGELKTGEGRKIKTVGVVVDPAQEALEELLMAVPLDAVQLHGSEPPQLCRWLRTEKRVQVIKTFSVSASGGIDPNRLDAYQDAVDAVLLDTYDPATVGGSGRTFNWDVIPAVKQRCKRAGIPLFVAGGVNEANVESLVRAYQPDGVDVSSGVETNGVKDVKKITAFVERVKSL